MALLHFGRFNASYKHYKALNIFCYRNHIRFGLHWQAYRSLENSAWFFFVKMGCDANRNQDEMRPGTFTVNFP